MTYPVKRLPPPLTNRLHQQIDQVVLDTLQLCMHEHYEDCPWREQALYDMDARNQRACGYAAFGEYPFALASLRLLAQGLREDGLLELYAPARVPVNIPCFSLIWVEALWEYGFHSGDWDGAAALLPIARALLDAAHRRAESGLLRAHPGYWNFYKWAPGLDGDEPEGPDAALNGFYALALDAGWRLFLQVGDRETTTELERRLVALTAAYETAFWVPEKVAYRFDFRGTASGSELVQALALLAGLCPPARASALRWTLMGDKLQPCTLSHRLFLYEALLEDPACHSWILQDIEEKWGYMLAQGATSFWETLEGAEAVDRAGSLCHGWSSAPVYVYRRLWGVFSSPRPLV